MSTSDNRTYTVRPFASGCDFIFNPALTVTGRELLQLVNSLTQINNSFPSLSMDPASRQFFLRVHSTAYAAATVSYLRRVWPGEYLPLKQPAITPLRARFIVDGSASFDPGQLVSVARLIELHASYLEAFGSSQFALSDYHPYPRFLMGRPRDSWRMKEVHQRAIEIFHPRYVTTGQLVVARDGRAFEFNIEVPAEFQLAATDLTGQTQFIEVGPAGIEIAVHRRFVCFRGVLSNPATPKLWEAGSKAAMALGIHPIGEFIVSRGPRSTESYLPPGLSDFY
jgi:hypothetical protein